MANLFERIINARKQVRSTQAELADKIGLSVQTVGRWERGERLPDAEELVKLALALDTTVAYLLGETDNPMRINRDGSVPNDSSVNRAGQPSDTVLHDPHEEIRKKSLPPKTENDSSERTLKGGYQMISQTIAAPSIQPFVEIVGYASDFAERAHGYDLVRAKNLLKRALEVYEIAEKDRPAPGQHEFTFGDDYL